MIDHDRLAALEARLALLEDKEKIREVLSRYSFNVDLGRLDEYIDGWDDKAVLDIGVTPIILQSTDSEARDISGTRDGNAISGKEALRHMLADPNGANKKYIENRSLHTVCNLHIDVDGDAAWAECYSIVFIRVEDGMKPSTAGYNHWDLRRVAGDWLVTRRTRRDVGGPEWGGETIKSYLKHQPTPHKAAN